MRNTTGTLIIYHVMHRGELLSHHVTFSSAPHAGLTVHENITIMADDHAMLCGEGDLRYVGKVPASYSQYELISRHSDASDYCPQCSKHTERKDNG